MYIEWQVAHLILSKIKKKSVPLKLPPRTPETSVSMVVGHIGITDSMNSTPTNANTVECDPLHSID